MEARAKIPLSLPIANPLPSYWQDPKSPLANVIEPEPEQNPNLTYDYAIIGSGISGAMLALNLLKSQPAARVVMLEAREACNGATGRNGGHTKAASYRTYLQQREELGVEEALRIARLEYDNIIETHLLVSSMNITCESQQCNTVDIIYDEDTFEAGKTAIAILQSDAHDYEREYGGMAHYEIYSAEEAASKFHVSHQNLNPTVHTEERLAGAFEYLAGRINAYRFTTGILKDCVKRGLDLCTNTPVHDIRQVENASDTLWDLHTDHCTIRARNVILATNGYTPYLLPSLQSAIVPLRGQVTAQAPGADNKLPAPLPTTYSFIYKSGYEYMVPRPLQDGKQHIIIGGGLGREPEAGVNEYGTTDDTALNPSVSRYLKGSLPGYFSADNWGEGEGDGYEAKEKRVVQEWTGIMGATADGRPFVGAVPNMKGVWISAGFNGHGMVLGLKCAAALVKMIEGARPEDMEWFPRSFYISEERVRKGTFKGRTDIPQASSLPVT